MRSGQLEGIVLSQKPLFEKDKRIEIFSKTHGKVSLLAKQAQSKPLKYGGKLDIGNKVCIQFYQGKSFKLITQCDLIHYHKSIRTSYARILASYYIIDLVKKTSEQDQANLDLYNLLERTLHYLDDSSFDSFKELLTAIHNHYLKIEGLSHPKQSVTPHEFKHIFEEYTGRALLSVDNFIKG
jgi:DNA repair protein RecO (recombination protein O)